jgi:hypothetical protein
MTFNFGEYKDWSTHGTWYSTRPRQPHQDIQTSQGSWSDQWKWYCSSRRSVPLPKGSLSILILLYMCLYQHPSLYHEMVMVTCFMGWSILVFTSWKVINCKILHIRIKSIHLIGWTLFTWPSPRKHKIYAIFI